MDSFSMISRKAARGLAPIAAALAVFGVGANRVNAGAAQTTAAVTAPVADSSIYREFGMIDGVEPKDPWAKDANGNFVNPDAQIAHKALNLYLTGAMCSPTLNHHHLPFEDTPYKTVYEPDWGKVYLNANEPGRIVPLVQMFNEGDERTKAIVLAVVLSAHNGALGAACDAISVKTMIGPDIGSYNAATTIDKIAAKTTEVESAPSPADSKQTVTDCIWASSNGILNASRKSGVTAYITSRMRAYQGDFRAVEVASLLNAGGQQVASNAPRMVP